MITAFCTLKAFSLQNDTSVSPPSLPNLIPPLETGNENKIYLHIQNYVSSFFLEGLLLLFINGFISKELFYG